MPGVDYPVGYDRTLTLKDPTNPANLPSGASYTNNLVTVSSNNVILNGFDFCSYSTNVAVNNGLTGIVISNNNFCGNAHATAEITFGSSGTITVQYNDFNGKAPVGGTGSGFDLVGAIWGKGGDLTFKYNYCYNNDSKCYQVGGATTAPTNLVDMFNLYSTLGWCNSCAHGEAGYTYSGAGTTPSINVTGEYNVYLEPFSVIRTNLTAVAAFNADKVNLSGAVRNIVMLMPGPQGTCNPSNKMAYTGAADMFDGQDVGHGGSYGTAVIAFTNNYLDNSGTYFPWYHAAPADTYVGNIDAGSGHACN